MSVFSVTLQNPTYTGIWYLIILRDKRSFFICGGVWYFVIYRDKRSFFVPYIGVLGKKLVMSRSDLSEPGQCNLSDVLRILAYELLLCSKNSHTGFARCFAPSLSLARLGSPIGLILGEI